MGWWAIGWLIFIGVLLLVGALSTFADKSSDVDSYISRDH